MNYRKLSDNELMKLINSSTNVEELALLEDEYVNRHTEDTAKWDDLDEDAIHEEINKIWKAR